jgi:YD repeat-containing protein
LIAGLMLSMCCGIARADQVQYFYDELGRLTSVVDGGGASTQYVYDPAGNISSARRVAAGVLSLGGFSPAAGSVGTSVKLVGSGFDTIAANNTVKFNSVAAVVSSATANALTVLVPIGASTGLISVSNSRGTVSGASSFSVTSSLAPTVSDFTPKIGVVGTAVAVSGGNFQLVASDNKLMFANVLAPVAAVTTTTLNTSVPSAGSSGPLTLNTPYGRVTTAQDFFVVMPGYAVADMSYSDRIAVNGASKTVTLSAGKKGMLIFSGATGQVLSFGYTGVSTTPSNQYIDYKVYKPDGTLLASNSSSTNGSDYLPPLPASGTYTLIVDPGTSAANTTLTLSSEVTGTLTSGGAAVTFSTTRAGQKASYTFTATAPGTGSAPLSP